EDIGAQTNIADFMRKEVPAALRNAALRRAWSTDPAIRDYVNPAREYAYDWNTPGGVPGNGPLQEGFEALRQVAEAFQSKVSDHTLGVSEDTGEKPTEGPEMEPAEPSPVRLSEAPTPGQSAQDIAKEQVSEGAEKAATPQEVSLSDMNRARRRHGGAAPS
ncbi:MAG: DUF3306 domain-containing protein, partial [Beijerinckiaceae bacterium]|nr:DUF3306 domain-containing protein [Beijerinckiaceae bacterium]